MRCNCNATLTRKMNSAPMEIMKTKKGQFNERLVSLNSCVEMKSLFGAHKADISMIYASLKAYANTAFKIVMETRTKEVNSPKNSDIINYHSVVIELSCEETIFFLFLFFQRNECIFYRIVCCCVDFELALELFWEKCIQRKDKQFIRTKGNRIQGKVKTFMQQQQQQKKRNG